MAVWAKTSLADYEIFCCFFLAVVIIVPPFAQNGGDLDKHHDTNQIRSGHGSLPWTWPRVCGGLSDVLFFFELGLGCPRDPYI